MLRDCLLFAVFLLHTSVTAQSIKTYDQKISNAVQFKMVAVTGGAFPMGSKEIQADTDERPVKTVQLSPFWIGEHEVTFAEWDVYFNDASLPQGKTIDGITRATPQYIDLTWGMGRDADHPVNSMSQQAAMMYCYWLYTKTGFFYRLPTEAEWEYSCKAGTPEGPLSQSMRTFGHFEENSGGMFHHIKQKKANAWGLYDMLGNLSEWTLDQYNPIYYSTIAQKDPMTLPGAKYPRTVRGGSYLDSVSQLRCSNRIASNAKWNQRDPQIPKSRWWLTDAMFVGFRVVRPARQPSKEEIEKFYNQYFK